MRKGKKIFVVCYLISFLLNIVGMFFLIFKGKISKPTREEFENVVKEAGCKLNYDYDKEYKFMDNYILADEDCKYVISYMKFNDKDTTNQKRKTFNTMGNDIYNNLNIRTTSSFKFFNHEEYSTSGYFYKTAILHDDVIIYAFTTSNYESEILEIIDKLHVSYMPYFNYFMVAFTGAVFVAMTTAGLIYYILFSIIKNKIKKKE